MKKKKLFEEEERFDLLRKISLDNLSGYQGGAPGPVTDTFPIDGELVNLPQNTIWNKPPMDKPTN